VLYRRLPEGSTRSVEPEILGRYSPLLTYVFAQSCESLKSENSLTIEFLGLTFLIARGILFFLAERKGESLLRLDYIDS